MKRILQKVLWIIVMGFVLISLIFYYFLQTHNVKNEDVEYSGRLFQRIDNVLLTNEKDIEILKEGFRHDMLRKARVAAHILQHELGHDKNYVYDADKLEKLLIMLDIDEVHIFDESGTIYSGTQPQYYGYSFDSGSQMGFFKPMLSDKSKGMAQDMMPNTAAGKMTQYAAVWTEDGFNIVQVGANPRRVAELLEMNKLSRIFSYMLVDMDKKSTMLAINQETRLVVASTEQAYVGRRIMDLGFRADDVTEVLSGIERVIDGKKSFVVFSEPKFTGSLQLCRVTPVEILYQNIYENCVVLALYLLLMAVIVGKLIFYYLKRYIIRDMDKVNDTMNQITAGNLELEVHANSTPEFANLSKNINTMVDSLMNNSKRIFSLCDQASLEVGYYEYRLGMEKVVATENMAAILQLSPLEAERALKNKKVFEEYLSRIRECRVDKSCCIYKLPWSEAYVYMEYMEYEMGTIGLIMDKTGDILEKQSIERERDVDMLTGMFNRRKLHRVLDEIWAEPDKLGAAAVLFVDANGLKRVNDTYGHKSGDDYLAAIGRVMLENSAPRKVCARYGGDEFVMLIYGAADKNQLQGYVDELERRYKDSFIEVNGEHIPVSGSVGVAYLGEDGDEYGQLLRVADQRMYQKKLRRR